MPGLLGSRVMKNDFDAIFPGLFSIACVAAIVWMAFNNLVH